MGNYPRSAMRHAVLLLFAVAVTRSQAADPDGEMVELAGGHFRIGSNNPQEGEAVSRTARVKPFSIDKTPVTNQMFREFVRATKYKTEAQDFGWSFVLDLLASDQTRNSADTQKLPNAEHWIAVQGAWWRQPEGPDSSIKGREQHPVVHVSHKDAAAYCHWREKRLPTETEWEFAARGGKESEYPWGSQHMLGEKHMMNIWHGKFPDRNTKDDGYIGTAPVDAYPANSYGVGSAIGNVWEWTSTIHTHPSKGQSGEEPQKIALRGGSFVDSADGSWNHMARVSTRMGNTADSGSHNSGFRCARDGNQGAAINDDAPTQRGARGGLPAGMDQEMLQQIAAERGVEGLQQFLSESGSSATVMTPAQLREKQAQIRKMKAEL